LSQAADAGDAAIMRLLIDRGADTGTMPIDLAMRTGCADCTELLLKSAGRPALTRALESASRFGDSTGMRMLLGRGAEPTAAALRSAAASEGLPAEGIAALLDRGMRDEEAFALAARHGETPWSRHCVRPASRKARCRRSI
jgi:ankyrin repeat protein